MQQITGSKKYQNGIQVFGSDTGTDMSDFFSYQELVNQKKGGGVEQHDILPAPEKEIPPE